MTATKPTLKWAEGEPATEVLNDVHLDQLLDDLTTRALPRFPISVRLYAYACSADILLGPTKSLVYLDEPTPQRYYISLGDPHAQGTTEFYLFGMHHTEWANRHLIPMATARKVLKEFFQTGRRSMGIQWEEGKY